MFALHKCCCCLEPKVAGLIIGKTGLTLGIFQLIGANENSSYVHYVLLMIAIGITKIIVNALVIKGILSNSEYLLLPWIISYVFCIVLSLCPYIDIIFFNDEEKTTLLLIFNIFWLIVTVVDIYFWFFILGLFFKYVEDERHAQNNPNLLVIPYSPEPLRMVTHNLPPPANSAVIPYGPPPPNNYAV